MANIFGQKVVLFYGIKIFFETFLTIILPL